MKVNTNLHSGNVIQDASQAADQIYNEAVGFVSTANQTANDIRNKATDLTNSFVSTITEPFKTI